jgi:HAE1 family hydrophobic/amphiphilic exporter-1
MAVAVAAGMFSSTVLTLIVVPVFYLFLDDAVDSLRKILRRGSQRSVVPSRAGAS